MNENVITIEVPKVGDLITKRPEGMDFEEYKRKRREQDIFISVQERKKPSNPHQIMELNKYQEQAMETCMPTCDNISYMLLNLVGEVGEFASKIAKSIRKEELQIFNNKLYCRIIQDERLVELNEQLMAEAGDILWQLSGLCTVMGWDLEEVAEYNLKKLAERKKNGTIAGNGDGTTKEERL